MEDYVGQYNARGIYKQCLQEALKQNDSTDAEFATVVAALAAGCILIMAALHVPHKYLCRCYPKQLPAIVMDLPFHSKVHGSAGIIGAGGPLVGLFLCLALSLRYNFATTTMTTDDACTGKIQENFMPSISAAIGDHVPQSYIWRICICFMMTHRFNDGWAQFEDMRASVSGLNIAGDESSSRSATMVMVHAKFYLFMAEQLCLIFLSNVSSTENQTLHEGSFIGFATCSALHMVLMCTLYSRILASRAAASIPADPVFALSYTWKYRSMVANFAFLACAGIFFVRHRQYCEPRTCIHYLQFASTCSLLRTSSSTAAHI
jgi:hypothetical protein